MKFIKDLREGERIQGIYLCKHKQSAVTKNGKSYENVILSDKSGNIDAKIWEPNSQGIEEFDKLDYIDITGDVSAYQGSLQVSIKRVRVAGIEEYDPVNYLPVSSKNIDEMYQELLQFISSVKNPYLNTLLSLIFIQNTEFVRSFKAHSAAKSVHHGFVGGLLEHTLAVTKHCHYFAMTYPEVLNRDLLITAAICHDMGKVNELSEFPMNDYTDEGQLLGHIVMGSEMVAKAADRIKGFPKSLESELKHCILAHHGEYEYGSPKKPALAEAVVLNFADNIDAKMETLKEVFSTVSTNDLSWQGYNRFFESNIRRSGN
ncbi:3'-5' exoribonuclease [Acetitomaculum ruminis DSM 5522]|uniref:3'-5' exoribonuclease n=1 Tax=Acetitomaculum ruminis DSM 5522 TaxID=1120918 RepID=A0A1I0XDV2_9FIRM|nr:HD domain-containing protein [Acetitomaculum ruminis]SFA99171.1 3'-5' exoribonuclease [Acetitomaculum ruminis DSM 5522]